MCPNDHDAPARAHEVVWVQYLRGIAALLVVTWHAQGQVGIPGTRQLQIGIEIFFMISGFIMWSTMAGRQMSPWAFAKRRIARVIPIYWALTTLVVALMLVAPGLLKSARFDPAHVAASYLFIPWPHPSGIGLFPVIIPGWTLNYEVFFYAVFGLGLFLPRSWRGWIIFAVLAVLSALSLLGERLHPIVRFYTSPLSVEFGLGVLLAMAVARWPERLARFGPLILLAGVSLAVASGPMIDERASGRLLWFGVPAFLIVLGGVLWEARRPLPRLPLMHAIGDASYSLYLVHPVALSAMAYLWRRSGFDTPATAPLFVVLALAAMTAAGLIVYRFVERPLTSALQDRWIRKGRKAARPLAAPGAT